VIKKPKRSYKKPEICKVKLAPEEALIAGCKTNAGAIGNPPAATKCGGRCNKTKGS